MLTLDSWTPPYSYPQSPWSAASFIPCPTTLIEPPPHPHRRSPPFHLCPPDCSLGLMPSTPHVPAAWHLRVVLQAPAPAAGRKQVLGVAWWLVSIQFQPDKTATGFAFHKLLEGFLLLCHHCQRQHYLHLHNLSVVCTGMYLEVKACKAGTTCCMAPESASVGTQDACEAVQRVSFGIHKLMGCPAQHHTASVSA